MPHQKCLKFYSSTHRGFELELLTKRLSSLFDGNFIPEVDEEYCFYVIVKNEHEVSHYVNNQNEHLKWLLAHNVFSPQLTTESEFDKNDFVVEVGPR